jgi:sarcosine oxidase
MGSAAAYHLARRGQRVLGLDRFTLGHDRGSSHGGTRLVRRTYWEDPDYIPLAERSYELWRELERSSGKQLLFTTGGLLLGSPDCRMLTGAQAAAREWKLEHERLSAAEIRRRFPTLAPGPDTVGFFEPSAGVVSPEAAVAAHLRLAEAAGADLHFAEPAARWSATPDGGVTVATNRASYRADRLVICPGAWATPLLGDIGVPFAVQRVVVTWFHPEGGMTPFLPDRHPWWLWDVASAPHQLGFPGFIYGFPALDGPDGGVKMTQVSEQPCSPEAVDRVVSPAEVEQVAALLRPRLGVQLGPLVRASVCIWTNTPDHHFVLATHPQHPQVVVAAGCSGHAFKFVPVIGEIAADLAVDGKTAHSIALFEASRARSFAPG